jgi:hypothetical protein
MNCKDLFDEQRRDLGFLARGQLLIAIVAHLVEQVQSGPRSGTAGGEALAQLEDPFAHVFVQSELVLPCLAFDDLAHLLIRQRLDAHDLEQRNEFGGTIHVLKLIGGRFADEPKAAVGNPRSHRIQNVLIALNGRPDGGQIPHVGHIQDGIRLLGVRHETSQF